MKNCPICGQAYQSDLCPNCSYDDSRNYSIHPTLAPIPDGLSAIVSQPPAEQTAPGSKKPTVNLLAIALAVCVVIIIGLSITLVSVLNPKDSYYGKLQLSDGTYSGDVTSGIPHGYGTMVYENGDVYTGQWENGVRQGKGRLTTYTGDIYDGQWQNDTRHGYGTMIWTNGASYTGQWENDWRRGHGTFISANGEILNGYWNKGRFIG